MLSSPICSFLGLARSRQRDSQSPRATTHRFASAIIANPPTARVGSARKVPRFGSMGRGLGSLCGHFSLHPQTASEQRSRPKSAACLHLGQDSGRRR